MDPSYAKVVLRAYVRRAYPNMKKASELPFPDFWRAVADWITFHAPRVADVMMRRFIESFIITATTAEAMKTEPEKPIVPDDVKELWKEYYHQHAHQCAHKERTSGNE